MSDSDRRITEEQAKRLWERAAQIQAEAAQREEERIKDEASEESSQQLFTSVIRGYVAFGELVGPQRL